VDQVVNGFSGSTATPTSSNFTCTVGGGPNSSPVLNKVGVGAGNALGTNPQCIFLGKALQLNDDQTSADSSHIYAYSILGRRTYNSGGTDATTDSIKNANPIAACFPQTGPPAQFCSNVNLTEDYKIPEGVRVLSIKTSRGSGASRTITCSSNCSHIVGFFSSFSSGSTANGSSSLLTVQYDFKQNRTKNDNQVLNCLNLQGTCNTASPNLDPIVANWEVCFDNQKDDERALLTITSSNGFGASTQVTTGIKAEVCS
jgi:hypothetical protein